MIKQQEQKEYPYQIHGKKRQPQRQPGLEDEWNDSHKIGKLGKEHETLSHHFDRVWVFLENALWFKLMSLIFLL